jgi:hypothetical protein
MKIYALGQDDSFRTLVQVGADGEVKYERSIAIRATSLFGQPFGADYVPVALSWGTSGRKKDSDVHTMLSPFLVISDRALASLSSFFDDSGQRLSVEAPVAGVVGFHVTRKLDDAVDMASSKFKIYPSATIFNRIVLLEDKVRGADVFRIKEKPSTVFVSERFKVAVEENKLKGFDFTEIPLATSPPA